MPPFAQPGKPRGLVAPWGACRYIWVADAVSIASPDKQRIAAVKKLEQLGYTFADYDWTHSANDAAAIAPTIHRRAPCHAGQVRMILDGYPGSDEERELAAIERAI